jgi:hypothetical protein
VTSNDLSQLQRDAVSDLLRLSVQLGVATAAAALALSVHTRSTDDSRPLLFVLASISVLAALVGGLGLALPLVGRAEPLGLDGVRRKLAVAAWAALSFDLVLALVLTPKMVFSKTVADWIAIIVTLLVVGLGITSLFLVMRRPTSTPMPALDDDGSAGSD